jgi:hypothetical protein
MPLFPRRKLSGLPDGEGYAITRNYPANAHSPEPLDKNRPERIFRSTPESASPADDGPGLRQGVTVPRGRGDAAHVLEPPNKHGRRLVELVPLP